MAKKIVDEDIRFRALLDSSPAQKSLYELESATRSLANENKDLIKEKNRLIRVGEKESGAYKNVTKALTENNKVIKENKEKMQDLQDKIGLTGLTVSQLRRQALGLRKSLEGMVPGSAPYFEIRDRLEEVNNRLSVLKVKTGEAQGALEGMAADGKKTFTFLTSTIALLTGTVISFQKFIDINGSLSDAQSDVRKTTGMTKKEVDELTKSFGLMKTRTARTELLKLSEEGGRLGITGVKNIQDYLNVANQLNVALKDDLSETQITEIGKMTEQYKVGAETGREFGGAMMSLGSAINEVAQSGSNQAGFLVDFLKRTVGISSQVKLSAADNIGYAATFDEAGQSAEVTGTMMNKVWMDMSKNTQTYAKIAGMSVNEFSNLLSEDANGAMLKFLEGLKGNNEGLQVMIQKMDDLDAGGARGVSALTALTDNIDKLKTRQLTANVAMHEATSLTDEYNIKNNNLAANIEKIKNKIEEWMSSDNLASWLANIVEWIAKFIGASEDASGRMEEFRNKLIDAIKVITILIVSIASYRTALKLSSLIIKNFTLLKKVYNAVSEKEIANNNFLNRSLLLLRAGYFKVTKQTVKATAAMRLFNRTISMNPLGLFLSVLSTVGVALFLYRNRAEETTKAHKNLNTELEINNEIQKELSKSTADFKSKVDPLIRVLNDQSTSLNVRKKAYQELVKISPEFNQSVDDEFFATNKLNEVYGTLIKRLETLSIVKARGVVRDRRAQELANAEEQEYDTKLSADKEIAENEKIRERNAKRTEDFIESIKNSTKEERALYYQESESESAQEEYKEAQKRKEDAQKALDSFTTYQTAKIQELQTKLATLKEGTEEYKLIEQELLAMIGVGTNSETNSTKTGAGTGTEDKKAEAAREKRITTLTKYNEERLKLERDLEDARLNLLDDGYQKEQAKEDENHKRKLQDLDLRMVSEAEIEKSLQASKNKKLSTEERAFYEQQASHWKTQNNHLSELKERETENHLLRSSALVAKYSKTELDVLEQKYQSEKTQREIAYYQELQQLGSDKEKRAALKKEFDKAEIEAEIEKLEALLGLYSQMLSGAEINGIDFSLLTPEAEAKLRDDFALAILVLEKLEESKEKLKDPKEEHSLGLGKSDILGFSQDQWETFYKNIEEGRFGIESMTMAVQVLSSVWAQYGQYVEAGEKARLKQYEDVSDKKQRRLKRQLDTGIINHDQYNRAVEVIETEFERNKAQLEYKQAKRKRAMDISNAIAQTALVVLNAAKTEPFFPLGLAMSAIAGTMGALQVATIAKQPLPAPGFEDGYYSDYVKREQDGKIFKSTFGGKTKSGVVTKPTHFLTGENGPEMIIDAKAFRQMNPDLRDSLIRELRGIKGFEKGYYNSDSMRVEIPGESSFSRTNRDTPNNQGFELLFPTLLRIEELLEQLSKEGVIAHISNKNMKDMKRLKEGIKAFERLKENNKV